MTLQEYIYEKRFESRGVPAEIIERWNARIVLQQLHKRGEAGAAVYLTRYGKGISEQKAVYLALKAEAEGFPQMALGFWKRAYSLRESGVSKVTSSPIRILFLASNPIDSSQLRLDKEVRSIDNALRLAEFRDKFDLKQNWAVRVSDIQGYFLRHKPNIVHFSGHGTKSSEIILEDDLGNSLPVSAQAMGQLFSILKDEIRCVVLNACYSERQAHAIAEHIDCVIGMSKAIGDMAAISFAMAFYQALGYGRDVKTAFESGCVQINLEGLNEQDTPKLLALKSDPKDVIFVRKDKV